MNVKDILKKYLRDSMYSHVGAGFLLSGLIGIVLKHPWPMFCVLAFASLREGLQQLGWPWKHEKQTFRTMASNVFEFLAGASLASILSGFLRMI